MTVTWFDRLKNAWLTARTNRLIGRHPVTHKQTVDAIRYGLDREIHKPDVYVSRAVPNRTKWTDTPVRTIGGWRHGHTTPPRPAQDPR